MEIIKKAHNFPSSNGVDTINAEIYLPQGTPHGILQISHGMAEHMGRYEEFAKFLCMKGYIVCGNDHIGHGKTAKNKEDLGYLAKSNGFDYLVTDLNLLYIYVSGKFPGVPYFLLGHSMGSFAARLYIAKHQGLSGAIISGTGASKAILPLAAKIKSATGTRGSKRPSHLLDKLAFGSFNVGIENPKTPSDWLSRDEKRVADYITDPLCGFKFSASAFGDLFSAMHKANGRECFKQTPKELPILMISGDRDPVGDFGRGVQKVFDEYKAAGQKNIELLLYKGGRHEMLNEINREEVFADIEAFISQNAR